MIAACAVFASQGMTIVVKSAERVLRILEYFAISRRAASASEIQTALELPQSSTSVLLRTLVDLGYLECQMPGRRYRPNVRTAVLGGRLRMGFPEINLLADQTDALHNKTGETVLVCRQQGPHVQYLHVVLATGEIQFYMPEGLRRPLSTSATGRALLSALDDRSIRKIVRLNNAEAKTKQRRVGEDNVLAAVRTVRSNGISETDPKLGGERDHHTIAVLVPTALSSERIAVGVAGPRFRVLDRRAEIIRTLKEWIL
jgi:IclR family acetate operon transcriptional repressor